MQRVEVQLFTDPDNNAVVRVEGRRLPGVLIQGDTLSILWQQAATAARLVGQCTQGHDDAVLALDDLVDRLDELPARYERVLADHDIELPYVKRS
jgi:Rad3-related DNA helicase